jgi:hypothetical protein
VLWKVGRWGLAAITMAISLSALRPPVPVSAAVAATKEATGIALTADQDSLTPGQSFTFTARVYSQFGTPDKGTVAFAEGGNMLGTAVLANGSARLSISGLGAGPHTIIATYSGHGHYEGSTSSGVTVLVAVADPSGDDPPGGGTATPEAPSGMLLALGVAAALAAWRWKPHERTRR